MREKKNSFQNNELGEVVREEVLQEFVVRARDQAVVPVSARVTITAGPSVVATSTLTVRIPNRWRVVDSNDVGRLGPAKRVELHLRNEQQLKQQATRVVVSVMIDGMVACDGGRDFFARKFFFPE